MHIKTARFQCSSERADQCPTGLPEFAFIGRSNVGKSSLINMLTVGGIAKVSATPGKTQLINHFLINDSWYLVDLPGYGYAKVSKSRRAGFSKLISHYVSDSQDLAFLFILVDIRHEPQRIDMEFIASAAGQGIPLGIVFTKADKLSRAKIEHHVADYKQALLEEWEELPPMFVTSAENKRGKEEVLGFIAEVIGSLQPSAPASDGPIVNK